MTDSVICENNLYFEQPVSSLHGWEVGRQFLSFLALLLPTSSYGLPLRIKRYRSLAVEISCTPHGGLVSGEGEHRKWHWDWEVDSNLASLDFILELAGGVSVLCED